jgi:hypothetical protein
MDFPGDVKALAKSEIPLSIFHPNGYKGDKYSWYVPNPACVRAWLEATGFSVTKEMFEDSAPHQRMRVTAKKLGGFRVDNPVW